MQKIYFQQKTILIAPESSSQYIGQSTHIIESEHSVEAIVEEAVEAMKRDSIQKVFIVASEQNKVLKELKSRFTIIQAAGGLVTTPNAEVLLIFRRGKWDLPKGKMDAGESIDSCAVREVEEETGLRDIRLNHLLKITYHGYEENGQEVLKETYWYDMTVDSTQELIPQVEEDIQECRWVASTELDAFKNNMQPSVIEVLDEWSAR